MAERTALTFVEICLTVWNILKWKRTGRTSRWNASLRICMQSCVLIKHLCRIISLPIIYPTIRACVGLFSLKQLCNAVCLCSVRCPIVISIKGRQCHTEPVILFIWFVGRKEGYKMTVESIHSKVQMIDLSPGVYPPHEVSGLSAALLHHSSLQCHLEDGTFSCLTYSQYQHPSGEYDFFGHIQCCQITLH